MHEVPENAAEVITTLKRHLDRYINRNALKGYEPCAGKWNQLSGATWWAGMSSPKGPVSVMYNSRANLEM